MSPPSHPTMHLKYLMHPQMECSWSGFPLFLMKSEAPCKTWNRPRVKLKESICSWNGWIIISWLFLMEPMELHFSPELKFWFLNENLFVESIYGRVKPGLTLKLIWQRIHLVVRFKVHTGNTWAKAGERGFVFVKTACSEGMGAVKTQTWNAVSPVIMVTYYWEGLHSVWISQWLRFYLEMGSNYLSACWFSGGLG